MDNKRIGIINWFWNNNRGAILTAYASQETLKELGYDVKIINYVPNFLYNPIYLKHGRSRNFAEKWLDLTKYCSDIVQVRKLNDEFDIFMCASDQIWRYEFTKNFQWNYFLEFADASKKIISMASSFGINKFEAPLNKFIRTKYLLKRFDYLSTREKSGEDILKNQFDLNGTWILDPVFLIDKEKYERLIKTSTRKEDEPYIFVYFVSDGFHEDENCKKRLQEFKKIVKMKVIETDESMTTEDWLYYIKNAKYVFSNSFHATCFALMFKTKAFTLKWTHENCSDRLDSLNEFTNLWKYCDFETEKELDKDKIISLLDEPIDYEQIYKKIDKFREFSLNWIRNAIESPKVNHYSESDILIDSLLEDLEEYRYRIYNLEQSVKRADILCTQLKEKLTGRKENEKKENIFFSVKKEISKNVERKVISFLGIKLKIKVKNK